MNRRTFVRNSSLSAFSVAALGSINWNGKSFEGDTETTTDILGPFYRPGAPLRSNLVPDGSAGDILHLSGKILDKDGRTSLPDVLVEAWQCDEKEHYDNVSDEFVFRGAVKTDKMGRYAFRTIVPVPYKATDTLWRPAHIHLRISSPDHQDLITQIYFKGDPYLSTDSSSASPKSAHRILPITKNSGGEKVVKFDVVMHENFPLDDASYDRINGLYESTTGNIEFIRDGDLLLCKVNGQLQEGLAYKGDNTFEGGLGLMKAKFDLQTNGETKTTITIRNFDLTDPSVQTFEGKKFIKYRN